ncbi:TetR/AcrR family transcriptional regulator [Parafannyhessea umbonata]|uniref:Regulatory protein, tetR family n=1 Tax=Parafannyhessea umbonata TaxID=604330 RepID=A0A1H1MH04_9ACTN|nr:TetR/AcrR family transcriptional regulator [Parafannyhessea umbonata]SDR86121.1 regulatory protein, tetR family [Parafannyhessea umbonata]
MGRSKYTEEERTAIAASFINATRELIDESGIDAVSIRKVANKVGCSSAMLYLYFADLDELLTLAAVSYLEDYCKDLVLKVDENEDEESRYYRTWEVFCRHTFRHPLVFKRLFFEGDTSRLDELVKEYYTIYPRQLSNISGSVLKMVLSGDLAARNMTVLEPYAKKLGYSQDKTALLNDVTISYFRTCLERAEPLDDEKDRDALREKFMRGLRFLTHHSADR